MLGSESVVILVGRSALNTERAWATDRFGDRGQSELGFKRRLGVFPEGFGMAIGILTQRREENYIYINDF